MRPFWPAADRAQVAYERLRELALADALLVGLDADRFRRGGLAALIWRSTPSPQLAATMVAVPRPRWSPYADPRLEAVADAYALLAAAAVAPAVELEVAR